MSEINNIIEIKKKQYHHLTKDDRAKIQSLIEQVDENGKRLFNNSYVANYIGVHKSTITRELRRIKSKLNIRSGKRKNKPYNADDAQEDYEFKRVMSRANYIPDDFPKLKEYIENKILNDKWSPDAMMVISLVMNYISKMDSLRFQLLQFIVLFIMDFLK